MSYNSINYQDWTPVTITRKQKGSSYTAPKTPKPVTEATEEDEMPKSQKFPYELLKKLMEARNSKNLTQGALAKQLMINTSIIQDLECNRFDYNSNNKKLYVTVMRKLGVSIKIADLPK
jgi:ribosome-binding protein aMBF1 (putative translation factor)